MDNSYSYFSFVYDKLMDNIPYDSWGEYIKELLNENGIANGIVAELGCGTGQITERLYKAGFDMIGIDNSPEMLDVARERFAELQSMEDADIECVNEDDTDADKDTGLEGAVNRAGADKDAGLEGAVNKEDADKDTGLEDTVNKEGADKDTGLEGAVNRAGAKEDTGLNNADDSDSGKSSSILYLCQDMREFELYGTVRAVISICDCVNYLIEKSDLLKTFKLVNNYLDPEGTFIFDFHTEHYYKETVGEKTIAETRDDVSFIWENEYNSEKKINNLYLTLFIKLEDEEDPEDVADVKEINASDYKDEPCALYERHDELHCQRAYSLEEIKELISEAGLVFVKAYDGTSKNEVTEKSDRITVIAREKGKSWDDMEKYMALYE